MKNYNKVFAMAFIALSIKSNAQGWIGSGPNLYPLNTGAALSPINVGIGTNSPSEQFHTTGGVRFQGLTSSTAANQILVQDATGKLFWRSTSSLGNFWNLNGNSATIPGTSAGQNYFGTSDNNRVVFATNALERMTILNNSGHVGIGTNSPSEQFHTTGGVRFQGLTPSTTANKILVQDATGKLFWRSASSLGNSGNFWSLNGNSGTVPGTSAGQNYFGTTDNNRVIFATNALERMTILNNSGNVGIGTSAPTNNFQVYSTTSDNQVAIGGSAPSIKFHESLIAPLGAPNTLGGAYAKIGLATYSNAFTNFSIPGDLIIQTINNTNSIIFSNKFSAGGNGSEQMRLNSQGYLGIGVTNPTHVIHVTDGSAYGYYDGSNISGWVSTSDARLKTDIKKIENPIDMVNKLNGIYYKWKSHPENGRLIGFLAQDVQKVLPEAVTGKEGDISKGEVLGMAYQNIVPLLVEAIKEQQKQINELKSLVNSLAGINNSRKNILSIELGDKNVIVLDQNVPNPFAESTVINYNIPTDFTKAQINFTTMDGKIIKSIDIKEQGQGSLNIFANELTNGLYSYSLVVDGKIIDTKKMIKE